MVISASSVHSPFSLMRNTDFVVISPREKPQLSLLPSSSGFTSVSSHQPWWKIFGDKRVAAIAVAICLSAAEQSQEYGRGGATGYVLSEGVTSCLSYWAV